MSAGFRTGKVCQNKVFRIGYMEDEILSKRGVGERIWHKGKKNSNAL